VTTIRYHYPEVVFIVPDRAMSAGAVFVMSGDAIMMDYFSCLGPIDPQILRDDKLVPALSYLIQFDRLKERSEKGELTTAEMILLQQLDLAELHSFEQARELSIALLEEWLTKYKFKNWTVTETREEQVTPELKAERAREIAEKLSDNQLWHSHGRPISMEILRNDLNLRIDDFGKNAQLSRLIKSYYQLFTEYMYKTDVFHVVHMKGSLA